MWTSVYMAQDKAKALDLREHIEKQGIIVMIKSITSDESAIEKDCYELFVPRAELEMALDVIINE